MTGLRVVLIGRNEKILKNVEELLKLLGCILVGRANDAIGAIKAIRNTEPDFVIIDADFTFLEIAKTVDDAWLAPMLLLVDDHLSSAVGSEIALWDLNYMERYMTIDRLKLAVTMSIEKFYKNRVNAQETRRLHSSKTTRNIVNKAKQILVESLGLSELQAINRIQVMSHGYKITIRDMAKKIIETDTNGFHNEGIM